MRKHDSEAEQIARSERPLQEQRDHERRGVRGRGFRGSRSRKRARRRGVWFSRLDDEGVSILTPSIESGRGIATGVTVSEIDVSMNSSLARAIFQRGFPVSECSEEADRYNLLKELIRCKMK